MALIDPPVRHTRSVPSNTVADRERAAAEGSSTAARDVACVDPSARVRRVAADRNDLTLEQQARLARDPDRQVRRRLALNRTCRTAVLLLLADDADFHTRFSAVQNPAAGTSVFAHVLKVGDKDAVWALAQLPHRVDSPNLERLVAYGDPRIREQLVLATTDRRLLQRLADDENVGIRAQVAAHPFTPPQVVEQLIRDTRAQVRAAAAIRPDLSDAQIELLLHDPSQHVRQTLAMYQGGRPEITRQLQEANDPEVARSAQQNATNVENQRVLMFGYVEGALALLAHAHDVSTENRDHFVGLPASWFVNRDEVPSDDAVRARVRSAWGVTLSVDEIDVVRRAAEGARTSIY